MKKWIFEWLNLEKRFNAIGDAFMKVLAHSHELEKSIIDHQFKIDQLERTVVGQNVTIEELKKQVEEMEKNNG